MPVLDHPVSDKVKHDKPPAGCYSRRDFSRKDGYWHYGRTYFPDGNFMMEYTFVIDEMSRKCRQIANLPECEGCTAEKDMEYLEQMRKLK